MDGKAREFFEKGMAKVGRKNPALMAFIWGSDVIISWILPVILTSIR